MDFIKNLLESKTLYCQMINLKKKKENGWMWAESSVVYPKQFFKLHQETYVPGPRRRILQLQMSALQPSVAKSLADIQSKFVCSLSRSGVVEKMTYGPGETDMRAMRCRELFTAVTNALEKNKGTFVRSVSPDSNNLCYWFQTIQRYTIY
jgi:hypothetical protein